MLSYLSSFSLTSAPLGLALHDHAGDLGPTRDISPDCSPQAVRPAERSCGHALLPGICLCTQEGDTGREHGWHNGRSGRRRAAAGLSGGSGALLPAQALPAQRPAGATG